MSNKKKRKIINTSLPNFTTETLIIFKRFETTEYGHYLVINSVQKCNIINHTKVKVLTI